jgi:hypothetical protein
MAEERGVSQCLAPLHREIFHPGANIAISAALDLYAAESDPLSFRRPAHSCDARA